MSAATEELKKVLQNRNLDNFAPKPFGKSRTSYKHAAFKPPEKTGDTNAPKQGLGPIFTSNELTNRKLKPVSTIDNASIGSTTEDDNVPEFLRKKLKTPAEKRIEASQKNAVHTISNAINRDTSLPAKAPIVTAQKPVIATRPTQNGHVHPSRSIQEDNELSRDRAPSVKDRSSFFEEQDKNAKPATIPRKPTIKPKLGSLTRNVQPPKPTDKPVPPKPWSNKVENQDSNISKVIPTGEELYDDVTSSDGNQLNTSSNDNSSTNRNELETNRDDVYDDVSPTAANDFPPLPTELLPVKNMVEQDELYDDVVNHTTSTGVPSQNLTPVQNDDAETTNVNKPSTNQPNLQEDELYDDVAVSTEPQQPEVRTPIKLPKSFSELPYEKFIVPFGLERWLHTTLLTHKTRLKTFANTPFNPPVIQRGVKPTERIPTEDELSEEENYDDVRIMPGDDSSIKSEKSEKERKKEEKERLEREKKEKKEKEKREKEERRKEKKEKERKEKEFKQFGLNPDQPVVIIGSVSCCSDYTPKAKDKQDIPYNIGDEINIIEYKKSPANKMLVNNTTTGRLGYVLRKDFGMEDETPEPDAPRNRTVSLIPTEPEDGELYEDIPGQQMLIRAPPVPETPRPNLFTGAAEEELYNDVDDPAVDCIYEEL